MAGRLLKIILFLEVLHLINCLPKNNFRDQISSKNGITKLKVKNSKNTRLRLAESDVEPTLTLSEVDIAVEAQNEMNHAKEQIKPNGSETQDRHDESGRVSAKNSISVETENDQGTISSYDDNENEQGLENFNGQKENNIELYSNETDVAKEPKSESNTANGQNKEYVSDPLDLQDKSGLVQALESISEEADSISQGTLSEPDTNQNKENLDNLDDKNNTISENDAVNMDNNEDQKLNGNQDDSLAGEKEETQHATPEEVYTDSSWNMTKEDGEWKERSLIAGDTFTPSEMLPITTKLMTKVEVPGSGKGIVSSATNPRELADRLFEAFFLTYKRIVTLKDFDISGLDALQALALSGEQVNLRSATHSIPRAPKQIISFRGQFIGHDMKTRRSNYTLITKKIKTGHENVRKGNSRRDLAKRLMKKRRLVLNSKRRLDSKSTKKHNEPTRTESITNSKKITPKNIEMKKRKQTETKENTNTKLLKKKTKSIKKLNNASTTTKPICRWRYECGDLADLDSCRLHTQCIKDEDDNKKFIPVKHREDEHSMSMRKFRKILGITFVDEEVEKILENRFAHLRPSNLEGIERIESLSEYFNKIVMAEYLGSTSPSWDKEKGTADTTLKRNV